MWGTDWSDGMHHWFWMWGFPFGGFWTLILVVALVGFFLSRSPYRRHHMSRSPALDLLEQRYARGEIGRDEYLEKKRDLMS